MNLPAGFTTGHRLSLSRLRNCANEGIYTLPKSWTILQGAGVFDNVGVKTLPLSTRACEKTGNRKVADDAAVEKED